MSIPETPDSPGSDEGGKTHSRRSRAVWWVAGATAFAVALGGGFIAVSAFGASQEAPQEKPKYETSAIERGTLTGTRTVPGVLDYGDSRALGASIGGVLTHLPDEGSVIDRGGVLFAVDNAPVILLLGALPAWRPYESGMTNGPDVKQLEENLRDLGFFTHDPDEEFNWNTQSAIREWQEHTGQERTGHIDLGRVVFNSGALRVAQLVLAVGDKVGPGATVIQLSGLVQEVTADLKLADQKLGVVDAPVQVQLPGGASTTGKITHVGLPIERDDNGQKVVVVPIRIALDDTNDVAGIQRANVTVDIPSETKEDVLSVPLNALIALPGEEFGVEMVDDAGLLRQVPVTTGLFAGGRVEVSGDGLEEGNEVVVPGT